MNTFGVSNGKAEVPDGESIAFGGPIATVGDMQRDLVEQRAWICKQDPVDGIALGQAMPGPLAVQVAMWGGYLSPEPSRPWGRPAPSSRPRVCWSC